MNDDFRNYIKNTLRPDDELVAQLFLPKKKRTSPALFITATLCMIAISFLLTNLFEKPPQTPDILVINDFQANGLADYFLFRFDPVSLSAEEFNTQYPMFNVQIDGYQSYHIEYSAKDRLTAIRLHQFDLDILETDYPLSEEEISYGLLIVLSHYQYHNLSCIPAIHVNNLEDKQESIINGTAMYVFGHDDKISYAFFEHEGLYISIEAYGMDSELFIHTMTMFIK